MLARLVRLHLEPGARAHVEALVADLRPARAERPGFVSATSFGDDSLGQWGVFVLWESQEAADASAAVMRPHLDAHLKGHLQAPPDTGLFAVLTA